MFTYSLSVSGMFLTIVAAVLALIVIAVMIYIFAGESGDVKKQISKCELRGGACQKTACSNSIEITRGCDINSTYNKTFYCCAK